MMKISDGCLSIVKKWEGYKTKLPDGGCRAYLDKIAKPPVWTIGWGCTGKHVHEGLEWSRSKAEAELRRELSVHEANVNRVVRVPMNQNQFDALVSFSYNYGLSWKRCPTLLNAIHREDWKDVADLLPRIYGVVKGVQIPGLINRRRDEARLLLAPSKKEIVKSSTKLSAIARIRTFLLGLIPSGGLADYFGWMEPIKEYIVDNPYKLVLASILIVWVISKWIEFKSVEDAKAGRYVPSGLAEVAEEDTSLETRERPDAETDAVLA